MPKFTEETIQKIFGSEAAEDEDISRLKNYYFKSDIYKKIHNELPLRILVGHKGIGKSATFKISSEENRNSNNVVVWIRPDDIMGICDDDTDFLRMIRSWKIGLLDIIYKNVLENVGINSDEEKKPILNGSGKLIKAVGEIFNKKIKEYVDSNIINKEIINAFLKNNKIFVYIDDLDRGWDSAKQGVQRISALLNASRDLTNDNEGLRIRISLRSDVYFLVRTSDESTDKIEGSVIWYSWTQHEILCMLAKRIQTYYGKNLRDNQLIKMPQFEISKKFNNIFEPRFQGVGKWENAPTFRVLASMIRRRPRDLVKLSTLAARTAYENNHEIITSEDLRTNFDKYSQERLQDTINEYRSELPDIERLLLGMKPSRKEKHTSEEFIYTSENLIKKIEKITEKKAFTFSKGKEATNEELAAFLYKINFLVGRKDLEDGTIERRYFEENKYLYNSFVDFGFKWEIHPAFRWALYPDGRDDLYSSLNIDNEI